jgi:hypothetical protein
MRIRISEPALIGDLLEYFQRNDCVAVQTGSDIVAVSLVDELPYEAARYAIGFRLSDWLRDYGDMSAGIID